MSWVRECCAWRDNGPLEAGSEEYGSLSSCLLDHSPREELSLYDLFEKREPSSALDEGVWLLCWGLERSRNDFSNCDLSFGFS